MPEHHGCAAFSRGRGEPLLGTASTTRRWLLLEQPGPWGDDALLESALPVDLAERLRAQARRLGMRPVLLRRPGRHPLDDRRRAVYVADVDPDGPSLRRAVVDEVDEVPGLLDEVRDAGLDGVGEPHAGPLVLVCTHGRHDACCAVEGRPTATALAEVLDDVWECSHVGGDRFAANVVVLPQGVYHGRVTPQDAGAFAARVRDGRVSLPHYRGRSTMPFAVQAAEAMLRRELDVDRLDAITLLEHGDVGEDGVRARFRADGRTWTVVVAVDRTEASHRLTCRAQRAGHPPTYRMLVCRPDAVA